MLKRINHMLGTIPYPFEHGSEIGAVSDVVVQKIPPPERLGELVTAAFNVAARFDTLMLRTLAALTEWAEKTETAVGLPVLPRTAGSGQRNGGRRTCPATANPHPPGSGSGTARGRPVG